MRVPACVVALSVLIMLGGCGGGHPDLTTPGRNPEGGWFGMADGYVEAGHGMTLTNEVNICVDRAGRVEITDVALQVVEGSLYVESYAVRPAGSQYPDADWSDQPLWEIGFAEGSIWVDAECPSPETLEEALEHEDGSWMHLGVRFLQDSATTSRGSTLVISYVPEGASRTHTLEIPFDIVLCAGAVFDEETGETFDECAYLRG